jgi:hypothetical protein
MLGAQPMLAFAVDTPTVGEYVNSNNSEADTAVFLQADNSKLLVSVPSQIHVKVNGDGTFITPTASAAALKNLSLFSIHVSSITSKFTSPFVSATDSGVSSSTNNVITYKMGVGTGDTTSENSEFSDDADVVTLGADATPSGWSLTKTGTDGASLPVKHEGNIANVASDLDLSVDTEFMSIHWVFAAGTNGSGTSDSSNGSGTTNGGDNNNTTDNTNSNNGNNTSGGTVTTQSTLDAYSWSDLQTISADISANGEGSQYYADMTTLMNSASTKTITLAAVDGGDDTSITEGTTVNVQIVGINHDALADGSGNAGLTFRVVNDSTNGLPTHYMNSTDTNVGGWEGSAMRTWMVNVVSKAFTDAGVPVASVTKYTHNEAGNVNYGSSSSTDGATATATTEQVYLASVVEMWGASLNNWAAYYFYGLEGSQYEYYAQQGVTTSNYSLLASSKWNWLRSPAGGYDNGFRNVNSSGSIIDYVASSAGAVAPCFSI